VVASRLGRALTVHDLVPLPSSDSSGATSYSAVLSLIIAALAGTTLIYTFTRQRAGEVRVIATVILGVGAGLITALLTNVLVGALPDHFFQVWGVATLFVLAIGLPIAAFQVIFGIPGPRSARCFSSSSATRLWRRFGPRAPLGLLANPQSNPATRRRRHVHARCRLLQRPRELSRRDRSRALCGSGRGVGDDRVQAARFRGSRI
jgi:hypothetical protein